MPTQAPTGSILLSFVLTAILVLEPGSLAIALISITCSEISGTSSLKSSPTISGHFLLRANCGPLFSLSSSWRTALNLSPILKTSPGISSFRERIASAPSPRSMIKNSLVTFFTVPFTSSPSTDLYFSTT